MVQLRSAFTFTLLTLSSVATATPPTTVATAPQPPPDATEPQPTDATEPRPTNDPWYFSMIFWTVSLVEPSAMQHNRGLDVPRDPGYISATSEYEEAEKLARELRPDGERIWIYQVDRDTKQNWITIKKRKAISGKQKNICELYGDNEWTTDRKIHKSWITSYRGIDRDGVRKFERLFDNWGAHSYKSRWNHVRIPTSFLCSSSEGQRTNTYNMWDITNGVLSIVSSQQQHI